MRLNQKVKGPEWYVSICELDTSNLHPVTYQSCSLYCVNSTDLREKNGACNMEQHSTYDSMMWLSVVVVRLESKRDPVRLLKCCQNFD